MSQIEWSAAKKGGASTVWWRDYLWLAGMGAVLLMALLSFASYVAAAPIIREEWELNNTEVAVVFSAYLIGSALSSVVLIPLTDRISPKRIFLLGIVVLIVGNLLFPTSAGGFWSGAVLRSVSGAGHVAAYITGIRLVSRRYGGTRRGTSVSAFVSAGFAGTTLSFVFMGQLLTFTPSWRAAYVITALPGFLGLALALWLTTERFVPKPAAESTSDEEGEAKGSGRFSLSVLRDRAVALVNLAYALHTAELYLARLWLPLLLGATLVHSGMSSADATTLAATLSGVMFMTGIGGVFLGGVLSDFLGRSRGAALIFATSGALSFLAGWLVGWPPAILIGVGFVYGFVTAADSAIYATAVTELAPKNKVGSVQAAQTFIGFSIGAMAPILAGSILDLAKASLGWGLAFSFNGALAVVGVLALVWLRRLPASHRMAAGKR